MVNKVNLDYAYEKWRKEYNEDIINNFIEDFYPEFSDYVEKCWQQYQEENELMDESNEYQGFPVQ